MNDRLAPVVVLDIESTPPKAFTTNILGLESVLVAQRTSRQVYNVINRMAKLQADTPRDEERVNSAALEELYLCQLITIEDALRFNKRQTHWWWPPSYYLAKKYNHIFSMANIRNVLTQPEILRLVELIQMLEEHGNIELNGEKKKTKPAPGKVKAK